MGRIAAAGLMTLALAGYAGLESRWAGERAALRQAYGIAHERAALTQEELRVAACETVGSLPNVHAPKDYCVPVVERVRGQQARLDRQLAALRADPAYRTASRLSILANVLE